MKLKLCIGGGVPGSAMNCIGSSRAAPLVAVLRSVNGVNVSASTGKKNGFPSSRAVWKIAEYPPVAEVMHWSIV